MTVVARVGWSRMLALFHLFSEGVTVQADVVVLNNKNKECDWRVKWESGMCNIKGIFFAVCDSVKGFFGHSSAVLAISSRAVPELAADAKDALGFPILRVTASDGPHFAFSSARG